MSLSLGLVLGCPLGRLLLCPLRRPASQLLCPVDLSLGLLLCPLCQYLGRHLLLRVQARQDLFALLLDALLIALVALLLFPHTVVLLLVSRLGPSRKLCLDVLGHLRHAHALLDDGSLAFDQHQASPRGAIEARWRFHLGLGWGFGLVAVLGVRVGVGVGVGFGVGTLNLGSTLRVVGVGVRPGVCAFSCGSFSFGFGLGLGDGLSHVLGGLPRSLVFFGLGCLLLLLGLCFLLRALAVGVESHIVLCLLDRRAYILALGCEIELVLDLGRLLDCLLLLLLLLLLVVGRLRYFAVRRPLRFASLARRRLLGRPCLGHCGGCRRCCLRLMRLLSRICNNHRDFWPNVRA
ncbi:hypothetical protein B0T22DRAFT_466343, partial [Podospora appendiculata]